jgi:hypothetical protein
VAATSAVSVGVDVAAALHSLTMGRERWLRRCWESFYFEALNASYFHVSFFGIWLICLSGGKGPDKCCGWLG